MNSQFAEHGILQYIVGIRNGVAKRFAGDGAPMSTATADLTVFFSDADGQASFASLHGGSLAARSGADDKQIEVVLVFAHGFTGWKLRMGWLGWPSGLIVSV